LRILSHKTQKKQRGFKYPGQFFIFIPSVFIDFFEYYEQLRTFKKIKYKTLDRKQMN